MIILFNDDVVNYVNENKKDLIERLIENGLELSDSNFYTEAQNDIDAYFEDLKNAVAYFDRNTKYDCIQVYASLGLWYGTRKGSKRIDTLQSALFGLFEDVNALYFKNKKSTLTLRASHHDGENIFRFYKVVNGKKYAINFDDFVQGF